MESRAAWCCSRIARPAHSIGAAIRFHGSWREAGQPDFRCVAPGKLEEAVRRSICWVCGQPLGRFKSFTTGPLCAVNGVSAEPPSHRECAEYSAKTCPFLTKPRMRRNERDLSDDAPHPVGSMIDRNPGVALIWTTSTFQVRRVAEGALFRSARLMRCSGSPKAERPRALRFWPRSKVGFPISWLSAEKDGPEALRELHRLTDQATQFVPMP